MVARTEAELGPVTILVNNAGVAWQGTLYTYDGEQVARMRGVCVSLGDPLQARREVGCLADDPPPLRLTRSNQVADDHEPSGDADTGLQWSGRLQYTDRCDLLQPGPYR